MKSEAGANIAAQDYQAAAREECHAAQISGPLRLKVTGGSMRPLLRAGDVVVARPAPPHTLKPGDIIVVQRGSEWITHRLVKVDKHGLHTHGDSTRVADVAVSADRLVGRVIAIERADDLIDLQQPHWRVVNRRINRVQRVQLRTLAAVRALGGTRSTGLTRGLAALINQPFQLLVRVLLRI